MGCSWFNTETSKKKTSINNKNMHQIRRLKVSSYETKFPAKNLQISSCSIATLSHVCSLTRYNFVHFNKGDAQNLPLRRVGRGRSPPSSSQRLTGMLYDKVCQWLATCRWFSPGPPVSSTNKTDPRPTI
jgi:hypothetical protein